MRHHLHTSIRVAVVIALCATARAQRAAVDTIPGTGGDITVAPLVHGTVQVSQGTHVVLVDPAPLPWDGMPPPPPPPPPPDSAGRTRRTTAPPPPPPPPNGSAALGVNTQRLYDGLPKPTLILVTDIHEDHLDPRVIASVRTPATLVVVPAAARQQLANAANVRTMANGDRITVDGVTVEAVPMYNLAPDPQEKITFHTKGRGNGYIVTLGGKRLYFAGDTACTPEMKALTNIDVAFLPMNLPYTMSAADAATCAKAFKPGIVYPYHYLGPDPNGPAAFEAALKGSGIEVRRRDWYVGAPQAPRR